MKSQSALVLELQSCANSAIATDREPATTEQASPPLPVELADVLVFAVTGDVVLVDVPAELLPELIPELPVVPEFACDWLAPTKPAGIAPFIGPLEQYQRPPT